MDNGMIKWFMWIQVFPKMRGPLLQIIMDWGYFKLYLGKLPILDAASMMLGQVCLESCICRLTNSSKV